MTPQLIAYQIIAEMTDHERELFFQLLRQSWCKSCGRELVKLPNAQCHCENDE